MTKSPAPSTALVLPVLAACTFVPGPFTDCDVTESHAAFVEAAGADLVRVEAEAGSLRIEGEPGISQVQVQGEACASSSEVLEEIRLTTDREGDAVIVRSEMPDRNDSWFSGDDQARLDLVIRVPERLALDVEDGSGSTEIRGVASVWLDDGSGSIDVQDVAGDVEIRDGSGSIDVRDVLGSVELEDGSGSIELDRVEGSVTILSDGSGSIRATEVAGDFVIESDGSGSIDVSLVGGDFVVEEDGSGGIDFADVAGAVRIPSGD